MPKHAREDLRTGEKVAKAIRTSYALRSSSRHTDDSLSLFEREREVANAERKVAEMKLKVADALRALAKKEQEVAKAQKEVADAKGELDEREGQIHKMERDIAIREHLLGKDETNLGKSAADVSDAKMALPESAADACDAKTALPKSTADAGDAKMALPESAADACDAQTALPKSTADAGEVGDKEKQKAIAKMAASWEAGGPVCPPKNTNDPRQITIKVIRPGEDITNFNINSDRTLGKLMRRYCQMKGMDMSSTEFFFGKVHSTDTASALGLTDGAVLRVFQAQPVDQP